MSNNLNNSKVWLIGAGPMAVDYAKVLQAQKVPFEVIGRGPKSAANFTEQTGIPVRQGGLEECFKNNSAIPDVAVVAVGVEQLAKTTLLLLQKGVKHILVEKPAGLNEEEIKKVAKETKKQKATVYVAYNRRFYASTLKAQEIIKADGGVTSFNFEFTEWPHDIESLDKPPVVKENWFLANSSHVVDLAFFLGGNPKELISYTSGSLSWHPAAAIFAGAGITENGVLFSYQANWNAPGRWGVEVLTKNHRLIFRPMEQLQIQKMRSVAIEKVEIDDEIDKRFKPGLYKEVENFFANNRSNLIDIFEQQKMVKYYKQIVIG